METTTHTTTSDAPVTDGATLRCRLCNIPLVNRKNLCIPCSDREAVRTMHHGVGGQGTQRLGLNDKDVLPSREAVYEALQHSTAQQRHYEGLLDPTEFIHRIDTLRDELKYLQECMVNLYSQRTAAPMKIAECKLHGQHLAQTLSAITKAENAQRRERELLRQKRSGQPATTKKPRSAPRLTFSEAEIAKFEAIGMPRERVIAMLERARTGGAK